MGPGLRHGRASRERPRARRPGRGSAAEPLPDGRHRRRRPRPVRRHLQRRRLLEPVRQLPRAGRRGGTRRRLRDLVGLRHLALGPGDSLVRILPRLEGPSLHRPAHLPARRDRLLQGRRAGRERRHVLPPGSGNDLHVERAGFSLRQPPQHRGRTDCAWHAQRGSRAVERRPHGHLRGLGGRQRRSLRHRCDLHRGGVPSTRVPGRS